MIEIIPKPAEKAIDWKKILSYLFILFFIGVIVYYFVLVSRENKSRFYLQSLEEEIEKGKTPQRKDLEKELFDWQKKINDFAPLLDQHVFTSKFFEFLEKSTHPKIFFSKIDLNSKTSEVTLSGQADSFSALRQQILIFSKQPLVLNLNFGNFALNKEGKVEFSLKISLNPKIFKY